MDLILSVMAGYLRFFILIRFSDVMPFSNEILKSTLKNFSENLNEYLETVKNGEGSEEIQMLYKVMEAAIGLIRGDLKHLAGLARLFGHYDEKNVEKVLKILHEFKKSLWEGNVIDFGKKAAV